MTQKPPKPGLFDDQTEKQVRMLEELAQIGQNACDKVRAQIMTDGADVVGLLMAHASLVRACEQAMALRERLKRQAASRTAPTRRIPLDRLRYNGR